MANLKSLKKYFYIYKTTNLLNGKFYIGMHSTNNLNDGYLGSGKKLRYSVRKYGKENFKLEILEFLTDFSLLKERERNLVNEELLKDPMCMNLKPGGTGGFCNEEHKLKFIQIGSTAGNKRIIELMKLPEIWKVWSDVRKETWKNMNSDTRVKALRGLSEQWGSLHTEETKRKMSEKAKLHTGELNSQYGTCWITNGKENKKIKNDDILSEGWYLGRMTKTI